MKGKVKFFNMDRGFGFIANDDGEEYFVHQTGLKNGVAIMEGDTVTFDVEQGNKGPRAVNVAKVTDEGTAVESAGEESTDKSTEEESTDKNTGEE